MRIIIYFTIFLIILPATCYLQEKRDYIWQLGNKSEASASEGIQMSFSNEGLKIDTFYRSMGFEYFNASISDSEGTLILYSNRCGIRDGYHQFIQCLVLK